MSIKIGVLSDTHMIRPTDALRAQVARCFADVSVILHAGDLTDLSVLDVFSDKEIYAVHGNMCHGASRNTLPRQRIIEIGGFRIGLIHGMGLYSHIEDHLMQLFDEVDCIVSGHTHRPVCHRLYGVLFVNPGCFMGSGRYGAPGTYALMEAGESLTCHILDVPQDD